MVTPYEHKKISDDTFIRTFAADADNSDLCWHRDREHRVVTVLEGNGWALQLDNCLPLSLLPNREYFIPKEVYHRLIKGSTKLVLEITERK